MDWASPITAIFDLISVQSTHVGVLQFGNSNRFEVDLGKSWDHELFNDEVKVLEIYIYMRGVTFLAYAGAKQLHMQER